MIENARLYSIRAERIDFYPFHLSPNLRLLYVLEGSLKLRFTCGEHLLKAGEIEILNINEPVQMERTGVDNLILLYEFDGARARQFNAAIERGIYNCNSTLFYTSRTLPVDQRSLKRRLRLIYRYYVSGGSEFLIDKTMEEIVLFICERCHDLKNMFQNAAGGDSRGQRFLRVYTYMLENCEKKINLKRLAEQEYMSPQYLSKEFNDKLGINFKDTLEYFRVIQSMRYLITSSMAVTQISQRCGFSALRYFYKHFAIYLGCTPAEFRDVYLALPEKACSFPVNHSHVEAVFQDFERQEEGEPDAAKEGDSGKEERLEPLRDGLFPEGKQAAGRSPKNGFSMALKQAAEAGALGDGEGFSILCLQTEAAKAKLVSFLKGKEPEEAEVVVVFCLEGFIGWTAQAARAMAYAAAAAERFCHTAKEWGLTASGTICGEGDGQKIAELLKLAGRMEPVLLITAGLSGALKRHQGEEAAES